MAAFEFFSSDLEIVPCETFEDLFYAVGSDLAMYGMAPLENSLAGTVDPVWDLLMKWKPTVLGELYLRIEHCLIGHPSVKLDDVRRIYSHQQALAQCQEFISSLDGVVQEEFYDTAGAVKMIKERGNPHEAAIAPAQAAIDYQMQIFAEGIQTNRRNFTRFLVISNRTGEFEDTGLKSTVVLKADHADMPASQLLEVLTRHDVTLSKMETRKCLGEPWLHLVYLDFLGGVSNRPLQAALKELESLVHEVHLLGSYPCGTQSEARDAPTLIRR